MNFRRKRIPPCILQYAPHPHEVSLKSECSGWECFLVSEPCLLLPIFLVPPWLVAPRRRSRAISFSFRAPLLSLAVLAPSAAPTSTGVCTSKRYERQRTTAGRQSVARCVTILGRRHSDKLCAKSWPNAGRTTAFRSNPTTGFSVFL